MAARILIIGVLLILTAQPAPEAEAVVAAQAVPAALAAPAAVASAAASIEIFFDDFGC